MTHETMRTDMENLLSVAGNDANFERYVERAVFTPVSMYRNPAPIKLANLLPLVTDVTGKFRRACIFDLLTYRGEPLEGRVDEFVNTHPYILDMDVESIVTYDNTIHLCVREHYCG